MATRVPHLSQGTLGEERLYEELRPDGLLVILEAHLGLTASQLRWGT